MIKSITQNVKQDICSVYFITSIMLVLCVCLFSPGIGALDYNYISRPMIIEELLQHNKAELLGFSEIYNFDGIFLMGTREFLYAVFPLLSIASINRYCDERTSGFWIQKIGRSGRNIGTVSNLVSSVLVSILSMLFGLVVFALFIMWRLPKQKCGILEFIPNLFFMCLIVALGTLLSILISAITKSKFYSFVIPLLLFYAENEFLVGLNGGIFYGFSIQSLMNPENKIVSLVFILIVMCALCEAIDKVERGWWGIDV